MPNQASALSSDLLQQVEGIEHGLLRRRRIETAGSLSTVVFASLEAAVIVSNRAKGLSWSALVGRAPVLVPAFLLFVSLSGLTWSRYWLKESKSPFRYTFSVADFSCVSASDWSEERLAWLQHDLIELLSKRIGRLSLRDERTASDGPSPALVSSQDSGSEDSEMRGRSHIHLGGSYLIRERPKQPGTWQVEVTPWVRVGPADAAAVLAHSVRFALKAEGPGISADDYARILERVFFSVASQIYRQIREDVQHKIDLLPNNRFRAVAYFFEAEDYARSNTLDAYEAARELYAASISLYRASWRPLAEDRWRRTLQYARRALGFVREQIRIYASYVWPRFGRIPILVSRAQVGYANMLLFRRALASMSGQRLNSVFEARPVATQVAERVQRLPEYIPRQRETLFEAYVTLALTWTFMRSRRRANAWLAEAASLLPARAEQDSRYLFAAGMAEPRVLSKLPLFRRAVELDPEFEVAQYQLGLNSEKLWRSRPTLEVNVATDFVLDNYETAVRMNPGNIAAWGNIGYMAWLLKDEARAEDAFQSGLEYKDIKRDTFVAELEYGLARIEAERGNFQAAFHHYRTAAIEDISQGNAYRGPWGYTGYAFEALGLPILRRFFQYRRRVERNLRELGSGELPRRVIDALHGYVLNEFADACWNYYLRSGDRRFLITAHGAYVKACRLNPEDVLPYYRLYFLLREELERLVPLVHAEKTTFTFRDVEALAALDYKLIQKVASLEPVWLDGRLALALEEADRLRGPNVLSTLPHAWLWKYDPSVGQTLNFRVLRRLRVWRDELWWKWEREFDDVHVKSLFALAQVLQKRAAGAPSGSGLPIVGKRSEAKPGERHAKRLFDHIQRHFYPDDYDILRFVPTQSRGERLVRRARRWISDDPKAGWALAGQTRLYRTKLREFTGGDSDTRTAADFTAAFIRDLWNQPNLTSYAYQALPRHYRFFRHLLSREKELLKGLPYICKRSAMGLAVSDWLVNAPQPYWALNRLMAPDAYRKELFGPEEQRIAFRAAAMEECRSPFLYRWLGDRLAELEDRDFAAIAYQKAVDQTRDGALLRELGSSLMQLHRYAEARAALQKGIRWGAGHADDRRMSLDRWIPNQDPGF